MTYRMTRRELIQWLGGATAGCMLSPMPFALIDDLTIATQTRGRRHSLPRGDLDRFRTRCPGCPAGCEIDVLTVGGQPYLCVPAPDAERLGACAALPALHQLRLHRRLAHAHLAGRGELEAKDARDLALEWIADSNGIAGLDLAGPGSGVTALSLLMDSIPGSIHASSTVARAPFGMIERYLELDPGLELALDPSRIRRVVPVGPWSRADDAVMRRLAEAIQRSAHGEPSPELAPGTVVLSARDGVGGRIDQKVEAIAMVANFASGAFDRDGPIVTRRRLSAAKLHHDDIEDHSLDLLFVDASRAWQVIPWKRLRRKLVPGKGRLVVFSPWSSAALAHADLVLPTAAPLEAEEFSGGDDRHPELRLALCRPIAAATHALVDPFDIARQLDPTTPGAIDATARLLLAYPGGRLFRTGSGSHQPVPADTGSLIECLRQGMQWRSSIAPYPVPAESESPRAQVNASAASANPRGIRIRIEAPVLAGAGLPLPPVLGKLSRESRLVAPAGSIRAHPRTLSRLGLRSGDTHRIHTNRGDFEGRLIEDTSVENDTLVVMAGFDPEGFAAKPGHARDLLGVVDVDPAFDAADGWQLQGVM